jgi:hypothetical protein
LETKFTLTTLFVPLVVSGPVVVLVSQTVPPTALIVDIVMLPPDPKLISRADVPELLKIAVVRLNV